MTLSSRFHTISWKFLTLLIPAVTVAAVLILLLYAITKHQSYEVNLVNKIEEISQVHSNSVAYPLWTLDFEGLERVIRTIALHPEIDCVEVLELSESRLVHWPSDCDQYADDKLHSTQLVFENQTVGVLRLIYTSAPFTAALKREIVTGALFFFLLVCVAGVVAFASLQTIVGRPVQRLITSIRKSEKDDRREAVNWSSQDELGSVITAYNNMLQQVEENTNELIAAREQAESAAHTKSRFLANMSHELRTPLNAVIGITEMLREEAEDENKDTEPYDRVAGSGRHLLHLIDDILDFSKIEAGKVELAIEEVDLRDLLEDVIATAQPLAEHGGNSLVLEYKDDPPYLLTDPLRLRQIVLNLLSNACKFTEDGTVRLTVVRTTMAVTPEAAAALCGDGAVPGDALLESVGDGSVVVSGVSFTVKDTGIGISKEQSATLFEDFSQADNSTTRRYGGTGLGLAISQRLCNLLGGSIKLESRLGEGATFSFTLPSQ